MDRKNKYKKNDCPNLIKYKILNIFFLVLSNRIESYHFMDKIDNKIQE